MTQLQLPGFRTPRKDKSWASLNGEVVPITLAPNLNQVVQDLLSVYTTDMGLAALRNVTSMRIIGTLDAFNLATESVARQHSFFWGIVWLQSRIVTQPAGDASIPDPAADGLRDVEWLQRGHLLYRSTVGLLASGSQQERSSVHLDITQMRKQPTPEHQLALVCKHQSDGGGVSAPALLVNVQTMLALP